MSPHLHPGADATPADAGPAASAATDAAAGAGAATETDRAPIAGATFGASSASGLRYWPTAQRTAFAVNATYAWHGMAALGCAIAPALWPWWLAGTALNHAVVTTAGLWPRSSLLGDNITRLPDTPENADAVCLTFDDGPDPVGTPRVLEWLDRYGARATFFCIGEQAARHPQLIAAIVAQGHAVENHSMRHRHHFSVSLPAQIQREIMRGQEILESLSGSRPAFFRAPAGLRNLFLDPLLQRNDLRLAAWTRRTFDTRERDAGRVVQILLDGIAPRDILLLHDRGSATSIARAAGTGTGTGTATGAARRHAGIDGKTACRPEPVALQALPIVLQALRDRGLRCVTMREGFGLANLPVSAVPGNVVQAAD